MGSGKDTGFWPGGQFAANELCHVGGTESVECECSCCGWLRVAPLANALITFPLNLYISRICRVGCGFGKFVASEV